MKKLFVLICSTFTFLLCLSQEYRPFDFNNGIWRCYNFYKNDVERPYDSYELQYYSKGDTTINGSLYQKLYEYGYNTVLIHQTGYTYFDNYIGAITNDISHRTIRLVYPGNTQSEIIYDFNLGIGDTIKIGIGSPYNSGETLIVTSIDSVEYCNGFHKAYRLNDFLIFPPQAQTLIEGIGFNSGLIRPVFDQFENSSYLECYFEKTNVNCQSCQLLSFIKEIQNNGDNVFINYVDNVINVKSNGPMNSLMVFDVNGRILRKINNLNTSEYNITCPNIEPYQLLFLQISFKNKLVTKKIIR